MGPHVHDPRSGEIISAHIIFWHDIVKLTQMWYFVQCSASGREGAQVPAARRTDRRTDPLRLRPRSRAHARPAAQPPRQPGVLGQPAPRSEVRRTKYGSVASIMSYGRYNYVAQPEDKVVKCLIPILAPVRLLRHRVGLQADRRREDARGREEDARRVGREATREPVPALRRRGRRRRRLTRPC